MRPGAPHHQGSRAFGLTVSEKGAETRRLELASDEVTIGRVQGNDVVLGRSNISKRHARIVRKDGRFIIVDLKSTNGTYVNGRKITSPLVITETDKIYIGDFALQLGPVLDDEDTVEVHPTELRLLAAIAQRDEASRMVYADWLEQQGDATRAEFLRVQEALVTMTEHHPEFQRFSARLRELGGVIDVRWRYKVARPLIEGCLAVEFACPKEWGSLATTERNDVRYCGACAKNVYYCDTITAARQHAEVGNCVAVDLVNIRRPRDLATERFVTMGMILPPDEL